MELHPWNKGFTWQRHTGPFQVVDEAQASAYDDDGAFVLPDVIDQATLAELRAEIDPLEERTTAWLRQRHAGKLAISDADAITFTTHLVTRSEAIRRFATGALFAGLCADLLGPDARLYWDQAVYKKPEPDREFPWHQDNGYVYVEPQQYLTCWIPLVDASVENGCPWVVPGVHQRGTLAHRWTDVGFQCLEDPAGARPVPAPAGSIVVFSSLTPHRTGPNLTGDIRRAYILQYAPDGAEALRGDAGSGPPERRERMDAPDRQPLVCTGGAPLLG